MFLRPDDYVIAFEATLVDRQYTRADMRTLGDTGVSLAIKQADWRDVETAPGVYDWAELDAQIGNARETGMRYLLLVPCQAPTWFPVEWYAQAAEGPERGVLNNPSSPRERVLMGYNASSKLSLWHEEATEREIEFLRIITSRYGGDDVLFVHAFGSGEWFLPNGRRAFVEKAAIDDFRNWHGHGPKLHDGQAGMNIKLHDADTEEIIGWIVSQALTVFCREHRILQAANPSREIWAPWHGMLENWPGSWDSGVELDPLFGMVRDVFDPPAIIAVNYTHPLHGEAWTGPLMRRLDARGIRLFGGGEYCAGLERNAPLAAAEGSRLLVGVKSDLSRNETIEPWMINALLRARRTLEGSEECRWDELWEREDQNDAAE